LFAIFFGILSATSWGAGDFSGGLASRRTGAYRAVLYGEAFGLLLLIAAAAFFHEALPVWTDLLWCAAAGTLGSLGMLTIYRAMGEGQMSIAAPVSAVFTAALPVAAGILLQGLPTPTKLAGFAVALAAVWMIAQSPTGQSHLTRLADLRLPLLAGLCFGMYFIIIHQVTQTSLIWPMIASRSAGTLMVVVFMFARREAWRPEGSAWPLIMLNGALDVAGNAFYILAGQGGRLDVAAVLSSLYPGATVILAWLILKERTTRLQKAGILAALLTIILLTV